MGTPAKVVVYGYGSDDWGDLLTAYDGNTVTYDGIGNPLTDGTWTYTWQNGRQLVEMYREDVGGGENDVTVTYTYDANGMRIGKTVTTNTYHAHSYTAVVTAPTCTVDGYTTYTCACGDSYVGDVTDATGHTYTAVVTAPTCTADGYTTYTCACGDSYTGNATAALGHDLVETTVDGSTLYVCTRCDYTATHVHSYTASVTAPTCTVDGYTTYTCSCGDSYQGDVVAATGHDGSFLVSEPATCTEDGYEDYYCETCGEIYTVVLPAPGHTWTDGGLVPYCIVCNYGRPGDPIFWSLRNSDLISSVEENYCNNTVNYIDPTGYVLVVDDAGGWNLMPEIKILQHEEDAQEAVAEIVTSLYEATQVSQVSLRVFCHPISLPVISSKVSLFGFLVTNIVSENTLQAPQKTNCGYFSYRLFARVLDARNSCVQLGDIDIVLDCPIPGDIPNDSYISFDVERLDLQC